MKIGVIGNIKPKHELKKIAETGELKMTKWLDDGDCIICNKCKKALDERYVERKDDCVKVPSYCPFCNDYKEDIVKA